MIKKKSRLKIAWVVVMLMVISLLASIGRPLDAKADSNANVKIHYQRQDVEGWNIWLWEEGKDGAQIEFDEKDEFGAVANITLNTEAKKLGFIVRKGDFQEKDGEDDRFITLTEGKAESG